MTNPTLYMRDYMARYRRTHYARTQADRRKYERAHKHVRAARDLRLGMKVSPGRLPALRRTRRAA